MNAHRQTEHRISWTNEGLNVLLPLFKDVELMRSSTKSNTIKFVVGTEADVEKMVDFINTKVGTHNVRKQKHWKTDFWYTEPQPDLEEEEPPSNGLEIAFSNVGSLYVKHQYSWDDADVVVEVDEEMYESEPEDLSDIE